MAGLLKSPALPDSIVTAQVRRLFEPSDLPRPIQTARTGTHKTLAVRCAAKSRWGDLTAQKSKTVGSGDPTAMPKGFEAGYWFVNPANAEVALQNCRPHPRPRIRRGRPLSPGAGPSPQR